MSRVSGGRQKEILRTVPACVIWVVWKDMNARYFKGKTKDIHRMNKINANVCTY